MTNREKQIEEIANILWHIPGSCFLNSYDDCKRIAECIYDDGEYRKQSEVAKEIFDEIEKLVSTNKKTVACATYEETIFYIEDFIEDLAELKKKYTGEKKMSRYIDADKIISHLNDEIEACENPDVYSQPVAYGTYLGLQYARSIVETAETANVVQVVRCKDCAVPHNQWTGCPKLNGLVTSPEFYCSCGERRKEDAVY